MDDSVELIDLISDVTTSGGGLFCGHSRHDKRCRRQEEGGGGLSAHERVQGQDAGGGLLCVTNVFGVGRRVIPNRTIGICMRGVAGAGVQQAPPVGGSPAACSAA